MKKTINPTFIKVLHNRRKVNSIDYIITTIWFMSQVEPKRIHRIYYLPMR